LQSDSASACRIVTEDEGVVSSVKTVLAYKATRFDTCQRYTEHNPLRRFKSLWDPFAQKLLALNHFVPKYFTDAEEVTFTIGCHWVNSTQA
jgi:hypothetical protein